MKATELKFRAHEYTGREKGMMVIGTTTQLHQLSELLKAPINTEAIEWPTQVTSINIGSKSNPYILSFHIENNSNKPLSNIPRCSRSFWLLATLIPLAIVGVLAIINWGKNAL
jgi:hypothetical protein